MKKIWIIVAIVVLVATVDILVRVFWPEKPETSVTTPDAPILAQGGAKTVVDGDQDRTGPIGGASQGAPVIETQKDLLKERVACESVNDIVRTKKGRGITKKDLQPLETIKKIWPRTIAIDAIYEYHTCLAMEKMDFEYCKEVENLMGPDFKPISCPAVFKILTALSASSYRNLDEQRYKAQLVKTPKEIQDGALMIYHAIKSGDIDKCDELNDGPIALALCQMSVKTPDREPDSDDGRTIYNSVKAMQTGQRQYIEKIVSDAARLYTDVMLGEPNICETYLETKFKKSCQVL